MSRHFRTFAAMINLLRRRLRLTSVRDQEKRTLLSLLVIASEQGLPYGRLVRAWACDRDDHMGLHALADELERGVSLPDAIDRHADLLPLDAPLAIRCGSEAGTLQESMRIEELQASMEETPASGALSDTLTYALMVAVVFSTIVAFILIKITPTYQQILEDFNVEMPGGLMTLQMVGARVGVALTWLLVAAVILINLRGGRSWVSRVFFPRRDPHAPDILRQLAIGQAAGRPIAGALSTMARHHRDKRTRHRLLLARNEMEQGAAPWEALHTAHIISNHEATALECSETVGNTPWTLTHIASARDRKYRRRLNRIIPLVMPITVFLFAILVGIFAWGTLTPLVQLISHPW